MVVPAPRIHQAIENSYPEGDYQSEPQLHPKLQPHTQPQAQLHTHEPHNPAPSTRPLCDGDYDCTVGKAKDFRPEMIKLISENNKMSEKKEKSNENQNDRARNNQYNKLRCPICLDVFSTPSSQTSHTEGEARPGFEDVLALACSHLFHRSCICAWVTRNPSCPICKHDVSTEFLSALGVTVGVNLSPSSSPAATSPRIFASPSPGEDSGAGHGMYVVAERNLRFSNERIGRLSTDWMSVRRASGRGDSSDLLRRWRSRLSGRNTSTAAGDEGVGTGIVSGETLRDSAQNAVLRDMRARGRSFSAGYAYEGNALIPNNNNNGRSEEEAQVTTTFGDHGHDLSYAALSEYARYGSVADGDEDDENISVFHYHVDDDDGYDNEDCDDEEDYDEDEYEIFTRMRSRRRGQWHFISGHRSRRSRSQLECGLLGIQLSRGRGRDQRGRCRRRTRRRIRSLVQENADIDVNVRQHEQGQQHQLFPVQRRGARWRTRMYPLHRTRRVHGHHCSGNGLFCGLLPQARENCSHGVVVNDVGVPEETSTPQISFNNNNNNNNIQVWLHDHGTCPTCPAAPSPRALGDEHGSDERTLAIQSASVSGITCHDGAAMPGQPRRVGNVVEYGSDSLLTGRNGNRGGVLLRRNGAMHLARRASIGVRLGLQWNRRFGRET